MPYADGDPGQHYSPAVPGHYLEHAQDGAYAAHAASPSAMLGGGNANVRGVDLEADEEQAQLRQEAAELLEAGIACHLREDAMLEGETVGLHTGGYDELQQRISFQSELSGE